MRLLAGCLTVPMYKTKGNYFNYVAANYVQEVCAFIRSPAEFLCITQQNRGLNFFNSFLIQHYYYCCHYYY